MLRLLAVTISFAVSMAAQSPAIPDGEALARAARNPYHLARFIDSHLGFDWEPMWKALGTEPLFIQPCGKLSDGREHCSTELISVLDPDQTILLIQGDLTPADTYLRFLQGRDGEWRFAGASQAIIRNHPRRHTVDRASGHPFLRVSSQGYRGSGLDSEIENIYDLTDPGLEPVFSFPVRGFGPQDVFGVLREILGQIDIVNKDEIEVTLFVSFTAGGSGFDLGNKQCSGVYKRARGAKQFALLSAYNLDASRSAMSNGLFESLADVADSPSYEDLIRYDLTGFRELATSGDGKAKTWLKEFLTKVGDTPEARELKALLDRPPVKH